MAKYHYEMPDNQAQKMVRAFCQQYGYQPKVTQVDNTGKSVEVDNPVSPTEFAFKQVTSFISQVVDAHLIWEQNQKLPELVAAEKEKLGELEINITSK